MLKSMKYNKPHIEVVEAKLFLLNVSGPGATDIGAPSVRNDSKSIWDEDTEDNEIIDYEI